MKAQQVIRVRKRLVGSYRMPRISRRKWSAGVAIALLLVILVTTAAAVSGAISSPQAKAPNGYQGVAEARNDQNNTELPPADADGKDFYGSMAPGTGATAQTWDRMIIRTATVYLTVKEVGAAVDRIKAITSQQGGYVFSSESREQGDYTYATVTVYVPANQFDQIMPILKGLDGQVVKVNSENVSSSDVTEEYTDLQSQLRNLKATEARMLELQTRATELEDVLAVDRELRTVQGEIEQIQGRINYMDKRTSMSTVTLELSPVAAPPVRPQSTWEPFAAAEKAWDASLEMLGNTATALITVGVFLWWLLPVVVAGVWVTSRLRRKPGVIPAEG